MAYYLGYECDGKYMPIELDINDSHDICDVLEFTLNFDSTMSLCSYLYNENLIDSSKRELFYLIEKGKAGEKTYSVLGNFERIYTCSDRDSFDIEKLKRYFKSKYLSKELYEHLYASYLKKYGLIDQLSNILNLENKDLLLELKKVIDGNKVSSGINFIENIIESIENNQFVGINHYLKTLNYDDEALIAVFNLFKSRISFANIRVLIVLSELYRHLCNKYINETYMSDKVDELFNSICYKNDKIQSRNLFDLGVIVQNYKDFCFKRAIEEYQKSSSYDIDQDDDDYLEEEDFARMGTSSIEEGIHLRISAN